MMLPLTWRKCLGGKTKLAGRLSIERSSSDPKTTFETFKLDDVLHSFINVVLLVQWVVGLNPVAYCSRKCISHLSTFLYAPNNFYIANIEANLKL